MANAILARQDAERFGTAQRPQDRLIFLLAAIEDD